jgi:enoyl-CoA hydratase/carnithine racemase
MLTAIQEADGERVLTARIGAATIDVDLIGRLEAVLDTVERDRVENLVLLFGGGPGPVAGDFPSWPPGPGRRDMRYFARWDDTLWRISRLKAKTFAGYQGRVGAAAVQAGLVTDLRLACAQARLSLGSLAEGRFPGMGAYWLPKFVGLGAARRIFLLGEDLTADDAARMGLVDAIGDTLEAVVENSVKALRAVAPESARLTRRILDDCYLLEHTAAVELAKAARYKAGTPDDDG